MRGGHNSPKPRAHRLLRAIVDNGDGTLTIVLTRGQTALADAADHGIVDGYNWHAKWDRRNECYYAVRNETMPDGTRRIRYMHRDILGVTDPKTHVDHIHHRTTDNRRSEMRVATPSQNGANRLKSSGKSSVYKGVNWAPNCAKWQARIRVNYVAINLGYFLSEVTAACAYDDAAVKYFGPRAYLNFSRAA